jgi:hypothetical protein
VQFAAVNGCSGWQWKRISAVEGSVAILVVNLIDFDASNGAANMESAFNAFQR